jgi:Flp pilus assembly secretin CpaC
VIVQALVGNALHTLREGETYMRNRSFGVLTAVLLVAGLAASPAPADAQSALGETQVLNVALGNSTVVTHPVNLERVMITDPNVADAVPVTAREVVINGLSAGTTTLLFWDSQGMRHTYSVHVTADVQAIQSGLQRILPGNNVSVAAVGNSIILSGEVSDPHTASRALSLAGALSGADLLGRGELLPLPPELERRGLHPGAAGSRGSSAVWPSRTSSRFWVRRPRSWPGVSSRIRWSRRSRARFRSSSGSSGFGSDFTPTLANSGAIRLHVEPEVSSLDFASGVDIAGSRVPALLSRGRRRPSSSRTGRPSRLPG